MNKKNQKTIITKSFSIITILAFLLASAPLWSASAQDAPTETPIPDLQETPTPEAVEPVETTETLGEPTLPQETPTPEETATEDTPVGEETPTPAPTDGLIEPTNENIPPSIRIIQPSSDITVTQGDSILIQWEDEDPDDNALINIALDIDNDPLNNQGSQWIALSIEEDSEENHLILNTESLNAKTYYLWLEITDGKNASVYSIGEFTININGVSQETSNKEREVTFVDGTVSISESLKNSLISAVIKGENVLPSSQFFAVTSIQEYENWLFVSTVGLDILDPKDEWTVEKANWLGLILVETTDGEPINSAVEGTDDFSDLIEQIPDSLLDTNTKIDLDPKKRNLSMEATYIFPWESGKYMQYGISGVHNNGWASLVGDWKAVDFLSDGNTSSGHAPNKLLASAAGTISWVCKDSYAVDIRIGNLMYSHLLDNSNLAVGNSFAQGGYLGQMRAGTFSGNCGSASQQTYNFHVHYGFPNASTFSIENWTLNLSTQVWSNGSTTCSKGNYCLQAGTTPPPPSNTIYVNKPSLSPAYSTTCGSYWYPFTGYNGNTAYLTENAYTSSQSSNSGTWTPNLPTTGKYKVEAYIAYHGVVNVSCSWGTASYGADTSNARYQIYKTSSSTPITVIKDQLPYSNQWITLGEFDFNAGTGGFVKLSDLTGETYTSKNVSFSAMRFTLVSTNNPVPTISSISPTVKYVGDGTFSLTVNGTNFVSGSVVRWNGSNRTTTFSSSATLTASISASDIASAGTATVTVYNPTPGGGTSNSKTLAINYPVPAITSISPTSKIIGEGSFTLTVNGSGFVNGSVVRWNGSNRTTTYVNSTKLTAAITAADIANVGTASITVYNLTPGGGTSNAASLSINYPVPIISSISPTVKETGDSGFILTVNGSNFVSGSVVRWNGSNRTTTFVSSSKLTASISAADIASVGTANVTVFTSTPGGGTSDSASLQINYPIPQISSITPSTLSTGESGFILTVYGSKFVNGSVVRWNGGDRTTTFVSSSQITASIPASDIANSGVNAVTVFNPIPGGGTSGSVAFTVVTRRPSQDEILLTTHPTFICPSVANATMYNLQVSSSTSFSSFIINQTFSDPNYSHDTDLPRGQKLFWRTRAQVNGVWGGWSDTWSFTSANSPTTPSLVSPASNALVTDLKPKLDWSNSSLPVGAEFSYYHLQVSSDSQFSTLALNETIYGQSNSEFFPSENLSSNMKYYWRVMAFNTDGQFSAWSTVGSFRESILPPILIAPSKNSISDDLRPGFEWQNVDGASSYTIQVSSFSNMKEPKVNTAVVDSQYIPTKDLPVKSTLYWRVRANGANGPSLWSEVWSFNSPNPPGKPSLLSPVENALTRDYTPRLDWSTSYLPSGTSFAFYRLQVARDSGFTDILPEIQISDRASSEYTFPADLPANTKYYWRVMAVNTLGQYRGWSGVRSFRTAILPPTLTSPSFGSIETTLRPLFDWEDADGAISYQIQISRYSNMSNPIINVTIPASEYLMPKNLPINKDIYWRIRAKGANGPSSWSQINSFIINMN